MKTSNLYIYDNLALYDDLTHCFSSVAGLLKPVTLLFLLPDL